MSILKKIRSSFIFKSKVLKISFIGLDQTGKSSILKRILENEFDERLNKRTVGMEVSKFESNGLEFIAWDIGGQKAFRETIWNQYLLGSRGIIYVIDSTDQKRINESKNELEKYIFNNPKMKYVPVLLLANKQDLTSALSIQELEKIFNLELSSNQIIKMFPISCKTGLNIIESFDWFCSQINYSERINSISLNVPVIPLKV
jgi:small GTP-binding protein